MPLRLKVNVISECRSLEGQNSKSFSPTSVFQLKLTFEQQNSSEKSKRFEQTGNFFCYLHAVKVLWVLSDIQKWNYAFKFDVCVTVRHWYNNINNQLDATIMVFINLLAPELFFSILAHPVYKMWIIQEPNKLALW